MIEIVANGHAIPAHPGETLLAALRRSGVHVPTLCHLEGMTPSGACRLCVVELEGRGGLVPACAFPVAEGMQVHTHSDRAVRARRTIVELLLADHPDDCLYCKRNGSCELQDLAADLGVRERRYAGGRIDHRLDASSPAIVRDPDKCVLCGKCVRVCEEIQGVSALDFVGRGSSTRVAPAFEQGLNLSTCVGCGQCVMVCPTAALTERSHIQDVEAALADPQLTVVVQHAPSISVTLGEELGAAPGSDMAGALVAGLRRIGFDHVFDTAWSADLTVMEEAAELVHRIQTGGPLPLLTSCSPAWVKFVEQEFPELIPNLSTCKSPQQMMGSLLKEWWAPREGLDPEEVYSVAIMPCTAKKFEAARPEHGHGHRADVDAVLTTRELGQFFRARGLDVAALPPEHPDDPFGQRSSAGKLFGASGGVLEAALRTAHWLLTGEDAEDLVFTDLRGDRVRKEAVVDVAGHSLRVAAVSGLDRARSLLEEVLRGETRAHLVEVMSCPGGCVAGGGQPLQADPDAVRARMRELYRLDQVDEIRTAHANPSVRRLYDELLGEPLSHQAHALLHTSYLERDLC